jgi:hypothetical protein
MSDGGSSRKRFEDPAANESAEPPSGVLPFADSKRA